jgi:hypothetical protein
MTDRDIALERIVSLREASELSSLSEDTLRRRYSAKLIKLSPRRTGMRLRDVLAIGNPHQRESATP